MNSAAPKLPSIRTVASRAGVSTATVSNVLNVRRNVAPSLAARVHAAVRELGYIADIGASRLRSRKSTVAGVIVPDIANPFFGAFVAVLEGEARRGGYDLLIASSEGDPDTELARLTTLLTWRPAGVIVIPCDDDLACGQLARTASTPMVVADRIPAPAHFDVVAVDNHGIAAAVIRHLIEQGHRRILAIASSRAITNMAERCDGVLSVASPDGGVVQVEVLEAGYTLATCRDALGRRLAEAPRPTALFALSNTATLAALEVLSAQALRVGRDMALVGFDDAEWMRVVTPPLTAVHQPVEALGRAAWARLMARIGGEASAPEQVRLACTLEIRQSCGLPRASAVASA